MSLVIHEVDPASDDARMLVQSLDEDLRQRYPGAVIRAIDAEGLRAAGGRFLVGYEGDVPVACGALVSGTDGYMEVKRMFVETAARRRGHARTMLAALEMRAAEDGASTVRLETGDRQPEAIRLYENCGYRRIPCFGAYVGSPHSHCFEKPLARTDRIR